MRLKFGRSLLGSRVSLVSDISNRPTATRSRAARAVQPSKWMFTWIVKIIPLPNQLNPTPWGLKKPLERDHKVFQGPLSMKIPR